MFSILVWVKRPLTLTFSYTRIVREHHWRVRNNTVFELNKRLRAAGEERLPIVRWFEK